MSQTLTKPILLDETGQAIAGKLDTNSAAIIEALDDIKDAIGTSSEFIPVSLRVITPPTKTIYKVGERLDLTGMVVNLIGSNGVQIDVTSSCTFNPANGTSLTTSDTTVTITYLYQHDGTTFTTSQALTIRELSSIAVTTPPVKTAYQTGETLDLTGIVVTATYSDGFTANVTSDCTFNPANGTVLTTSDTSVTITYVEGSITKTTSVAIGVKELVSIAVTHLPTKTSYKAGETLDLTGIVVTATYDDSSTIDVTARCTFNPDDGDTLTTSDSSVAISYTEGTVTKTTSQAITVIELSSIAITTPPTKVDYTKNDTLDLTGIVVTATYSDSSTADVTASCTFSPADGTTLTTSNTSVTASYTEVGVTKTATQAITVLPPIYGVEWDGTATTAWARTDDAANFTDPIPAVSNGNGSSPFDDIMPWAGMVRSTDSAAGELVSIPKFYYKLTQNGSAIKIQIAAEPVQGFSVSPAHMDRGDGVGERDIVYVGRYHCAGNSYTSSNGKAPKSTIGIATARSTIHNLGADIWQMDFAMLFTIWLLYLVEFADWDSQGKIGYGGRQGTNAQINGGTDNMTYHTGTTQESKTTYNAWIQYRYIESPWGNVRDWLDGCYYNNNGLNIILNPNNFSNSSGGTLIGKPSTGFPSALSVKDISGAFPMFIPSSSNGSDSTYLCDDWEYYASETALEFGGAEKSKDIGLFLIYNLAASYSGDALIGCRLMKLPANS